MKTVSENTIESIVASQRRELLALKARQFARASSLMTKMTSADKSFSITPATYGSNYYFKVTFTFGSSGYFVGDFQVTSVRLADADYDVYFWQVTNPQVGDGKVVAYVRTFLSTSGTVNISAVASGSESGSINIELAGVD